MVSDQAWELFNVTDWFERSRGFLLLGICKKQKLEKREQSLNFVLQTYLD